MRTTVLVAGCCLALAGCQSAGLWRAPATVGVASPSSPATDIALQATVVQPQSPAPVQPAPTVQLAQHVEPAPLPAAPAQPQPPQPQPPQPQPQPETLPQGTLKPVTLGGLTLADAEQMALTANPSVARAAALVEAARGNWVQVGLPPNPTVGYEGQQIGSGGRAEQDGVFVEQEIVRGGKLGLNRQVAAQEWAGREQDLAAQQQRVLTDVRVAFYHVLIAQLESRSLAKLDEFRQRSREHPDRLLAAQEISYQERYQLQIELAHAQNIIVRAENRRIAAWKNLATIMGHPDLPIQVLEGDPAFLPTKLDREAVAQHLLTTSPEIAAAMTNIERARWAAQRALVERTPNVTVQGLVNWRDNGIDGDPDGAVTVGLPMPLWNRNQGGIRQAALEAAAAERALDQLELHLQNRLASIYERYASAYDLVAGYERAGGLKELDEAFARTVRLWPTELGTSQFLVEIRAYSQIRTTFFEALRELRSTEAEIEGLLLSGSLEDRAAD